ncbi:DUF72 domain-containing protein [Myxococcota bacterium]
MSAEPDPERLAQAEALARQAPEPAVVDNLLMGTAGWTDRTLTEGQLFYPRGTNSASARLAHYARHFRLVEVDATYYSLLPSAMAARWIQCTPAEFVFDVKAFPIFTGHPIDVRRLPQDLRDACRSVCAAGRLYPNRLPTELRREMERRFIGLVRPLHDAGRLGCVMVQYPPWFRATRGNARQLESLRERLGGLPVGIEFRHASWLGAERSERVFGLLRDHGFSYVGVDEPAARVGGLPPLTTVTHTRLALVRFHGRNQAGWERKGASVHERFDYLYQPDELKSWVEGLRALSEAAETVHAVFNNCLRNYAVLGAKGLAALLSQ